MPNALMDLFRAMGSRSNQQGYPQDRFPNPVPFQSTMPEPIQPPKADGFSMNFPQETITYDRFEEPSTPAPLRGLSSAMGDQGPSRSIPRDLLPPIDQGASLSAVGNLSANAPLDLLGMQEGRLREMERNREMNLSGGKIGPSFASGATAGDVSRLKGDMASSPFTGEAERSKVADFEAARNEAMMGGFESPQAQSLYERQQAETKARQPLDVARMQGDAALGVARANAAGDLERQREVSSGALAVQSAKDEGFGNRFSELQALLGGTTGIDPSRVSIGPTGAMSLSMPQDRGLPSTATSSLQRARTDQAKGVRGADAGLEQAIATTISMHSASDGVKDLVTQIRSNPRLAQMSIRDILAKVSSEDGTPMSAQEQAELRDLLTVVRGKDF